MLKQRIITSIILVVLVVTSLLYLPSISLLFVAAIVFAIAAVEWLQIINQIKTKPKNMLQLAKIIGAGIFFYFVYWFKLGTYLISVVAIVWLITVFIIYHDQTKLRSILSYRYLPTILGLLLLGTAWMAFKAIYFEHGKLELLYLGALVFGADTAAYFTGKKYGKHKLASNISPGKTKEGAMGAVIFVVLIAATRQIFSADISTYNFIIAIVIAIVITIISIIGDLTESMLKRVYNVKDSGSLLPGHGGMLDRIDSLIAALPVYYCLSPVC
jgi:phosphatidate cytidylyltransferase